MAAPGALVISKIVWPETEESQTMGNVKLEVKSPYINVVDAISHGAGDGWRIAMNVIAMLIGFIALIALIDFGLVRHRPPLQPGPQPEPRLDLRQDLLPHGLGHGRARRRCCQRGHLAGPKLTINEFVAFQNLATRRAGAHRFGKGPAHRIQSPSVASPTSAAWACRSAASANWPRNAAATWPAWA
jgi:CNT family concentrative nucleoside transporter